MKRLAGLILGLLPCSGHAQEWQSYSEAYVVAVRQQKPLIVFVRLPVLAVPNCVTVAMTDFSDVLGPSVVIGLPDGKGGLNRAATCYGPTNQARIQTFLPSWRPALSPSPQLTPHCSSPSRGRGY